MSYISETSYHHTVTSNCDFLVSAVCSSLANSSPVGFQIFSSPEPDAHTAATLSSLLFHLHQHRRNRHQEETTPLPPRMSRILSVPQQDVIARVSSANSMKELIELLPINVRPQMTDICEGCYRTAHKVASVAAQLDELEAHVAASTLPPQIAVRPYRVQVSKEFLGEGTLKTLHEKLEAEEKAYASQKLTSHVAIKTAELAHLTSLIKEDKWKPAVSKIASATRTLLEKYTFEIQAPPASSSAAGGVLQGANTIGTTLAVLEANWETALPAFPMRAIALGHASVQRDLTLHMKKLSIMAQKKAEASSRMDVDAPSSSTIAAMIAKSVADALRKGGISPPSKKSAKKSPGKGGSMSPPLDEANHANFCLPPSRKRSFKATAEAEVSPVWKKARRDSEGRPQEGQGKDVWEEVREFRRQVRNQASSRDPLGVPDMYLDMSEQARLIYATGEIRENELLGLWRPAPVFKGSNTNLPGDVERFFALNGKFTFHVRAPLDDLTIVQQWAQVEHKALWGFFFRNKEAAFDYNPALYVESDALIPDSIPDDIQRGLDAGRDELLSQAAVARRHWTQGLNPKLSSVMAYLKENLLMVKPTDKNLGLAAFTKGEYIHALHDHIKNGPYERVIAPKSALEFHENILRRLPTTGLTSVELKFIRNHRTVHWPAFHMIPKVHKTPWAWRPIVPAHSSPTTRLSKVADIALSQLLPRFPHLIRSTAEWVRAFQEGTRKCRVGKTWFVTGDVVSFYTNVDTETIDRSMEALMLGSRIPVKRAAAITQLVRTVTHQNYFEIDKELFRQTNGLAMGSPCSGTVANLALARKEKKFLGREGILTYPRYIDDIFALIEGSAVEVRKILQEISQAVAPLVINWKISERHAIYLDVEISASPAIGRTIVPGFSFKPYRKPGSQRAYLPWSSAHPVHVKKGIVIGETTRLALLCSEEMQFLRELADFRANLIRRGYPEKALFGWTSRVPWNHRFAVLDVNRNVKRTRDELLRIPTTNNPIWEHINLQQVFDKVTTEWRNVWASDTRPRGLSTSQKRGESVMDLLSAWNKSVLGDE